MESSEDVFLNMTKKLIIANHLCGLDEKRMASFKKALGQIPPPKGTGPIKKKDIQNTSLEEMVDYIFRCHTEKHAVTTIKTALNLISENQIRMLIDKELRNVNKSRKSMETEQRGIPYLNKEPLDFLPGTPVTSAKSPCYLAGLYADNSPTKTFESDGMEEEQQGGAQLLNMSSENEVTTSAVQYFEPPNKKIRIEKDMDAVPGPSKLKETAASKNEGQVHSPFKPLKPVPQSPVSPKHGNITNKLYMTPNKQSAVVPSHTSSNVPQPPASPKEGNNTKNMTPNKQVGVSPSHTSSNEKKKVCDQ
ncbi:uncharacterized protein [Aquarana catesbeiana]|uniref:uncharacterized protein isoform X1 n=1 Tax=Aquarana catesbeiana TaxID=8400 RepID=UPI003CC96604